MNLAKRRARLPLASLLVTVEVVFVLAPGCTSHPPRGDEFLVSTPHSQACPRAWRGSWQRWADQAGMAVWCPGWMPAPINAIVGGEWNTAQVVGHQWQLGFAGLEQGQLVHVVFEGYPRGAFPPMCEGGVPCFGGRDPRPETVAGHRVSWYGTNLASHTGHVAAVFASGGDTYVVSIHVASPTSTVATAKTDLRHIIRSSTRLTPMTSGP